MIKMESLCILIEKRKLDIGENKKYSMTRIINIVLLEKTIGILQFV